MCGLPSMSFVSGVCNDVDGRAAKPANVATSPVGVIEIPPSVRHFVVGLTPNAGIIITWDLKPNTSAEAA